jgi:hypothetical protein
MGAVEVGGVDALVVEQAALNGNTSPRVSKNIFLFIVISR